jgi:hypothetical protein
MIREIIEELKIEKRRDNRMRDFGKLNVFVLKLIRKFFLPDLR